MDPQVFQAIQRLVATSRIAALGTSRAGWPSVSMVPYALCTEPWSLLIHISALAQHTQDIMADPHVGVLITETDDGSRNPQTLARISIQARASRAIEDSHGYDTARETYLRRFPKAAISFGLGDFFLIRLVPHSARFIAGFGAIHDLTAADFVDLAQSADPRAPHTDP